MKWPSNAKGSNAKFSLQRWVKAQTLHLLWGQSPEPCCPEHLHEFRALLAFCEVAATTFPFHDVCGDSVGLKILVVKTTRFNRIPTQTQLTNRTALVRSNMPRFPLLSIYRDQRMRQFHHSHPCDFRSIGDERWINGSMSVLPSVACGRRVIAVGPLDWHKTIEWHMTGTKRWTRFKTHEILAFLILPSRLLSP